MRAPVKTAMATKIKRAVVFAFVCLAFVSQASAVLRPLFPIRPAAPSNDELIVIEDELALRAAKTSEEKRDLVDNMVVRQRALFSTSHRGGFMTLSSGAPHVPRGSRTD